MGSFNVTTGSTILVSLFPKGVSEVLAPVCAAFAYLDKDPKGLVGDQKFVTVTHTGAAGVSTDIATAIANKNPAGFKRFAITRKPEYAANSVSGELLVASKDNGAIVDALTSLVDQTGYGISRNIAAHLYGDGTGLIGVITAASNVGTATITLTRPTDVLAFEPGMKLQAVNAGALRSAGATVTLLSVDPDAGTLTATGNWTAGIAGVLAGDSLVRQGDFNNCATGFAGWIPETAPTAGDSFFGVDRSTNPNRLAGVRVVGNGGSIEEVVIRAATTIGMYGGMPNVAFMNHLDFADLAVARDSKIKVDQGTKMGQLGFQSFEVTGPRGVIKVYPDADQRRGRMHILTSKSWKLLSAKAIPHLVEDERPGQLLYRSATDDSYELRMRAFWNTECNAPGHNGVVTF